MKINSLRVSKKHVNLCGWRNIWVVEICQLPNGKYTVRPQQPRWFGVTLEPFSTKKAANTFKKKACNSPKLMQQIIKAFA